LANIYKIWDMLIYFGKDGNINYDTALISSTLSQGTK
jgi:hypothetical protein